MQEHNFKSNVHFVVLYFYRENALNGSGLIYKCIQKELTLYKNISWVKWKYIFLLFVTKKGQIKGSRNACLLFSFYYSNRIVIPKQKKVKRRISITSRCSRTSWWPYPFKGQKGHKFSSYLWLIFVLLNFFSYS